MQFTVNQSKLAQSIISAVHLHTETARGMHQLLCLHVVLNNAAQIIDARLSSIGIKRGGKDWRLTAVEIDSQIHGTALEVRHLEYIGNARSKTVCLRIKVEIHKR
ncbi:MAG: hypothetical protein EGQ88_03170 [Prevotellamassilia timonensis]|nr:hypothetical protein [Prevotellamassilia timonensis]